MRRALFLAGSFAVKENQDSRMEKCTMYYNWQ
jgi:hypothetical protein